MRSTALNLVLGEKERRKNVLLQTKIDSSGQREFCVQSALKSHTDETFDLCRRLQIGNI